MILSPMRYKSYTWPHNPRVYTIDYQRVMAVHKVPFGGYQLQDLGLTRRVMKGEGEFSGEGAYDEFKKLACVFYEVGPGLLVHPLWQVANTYFAALRLEQAPRPDYVRYSFEFWEESGTYSGVVTRATQPAQGEEGAAAVQAADQASFHRVVKGDTLWALSKRYGVKLADLIALNPQIKNPNLIYTGQEVRVR